MRVGGGLPELSTVHGNEVGCAEGSDVVRGVEVAGEEPDCPRDDLGMILGVLC